MFWSVVSASPSSVAVRRAAAAGLLSSCASPAERVPSAASFSCWRTSASAAWAIGAIRRIAVFIALGASRRNARNVGTSHDSRRTSVVARPLASSASPVSALAAPKYVGPARWLRMALTPLMRRDDSISPAAITEKCSGTVPSVKSGAPGARCSSRPAAANAASTSGSTPVEEVEHLEHLDHLGHVEHLAHTAAPRYSWTKDTAIEPSPTAEATRFIDSLRTSPATNTPGMLVSSR